MNGDDVNKFKPESVGDAANQNNITNNRQYPLALSHLFGKVIKRTLALDLVNPKRPQKLKFA